MNRQLKMVWDFRGPDALKTAEHHEIHLKEYIQKEHLQATTGFIEQNDLHAFAFMIINEKDMLKVRDELIPHRAFWHESED
ncbi:hypothetical protein ACF3NR_08760 [Vaginella massiliensis]|uniref:hypothetical protein n=1 Tax=Vaginella massiliensis TaxID=1816680 RepID=UPI0008384836|nr:hypothetical protein [Vaginella massiliensis]